MIGTLQELTFEIWTYLNMDMKNEKNVKETIF